MMSRRAICILFSILTLLLTACQPAAAPAPRAGGAAFKVLATTTFLADITQNVAGDRLPVRALLPAGVDPHSYEPTPKDVALVADSQALIINGAGYEGFLAKLLESSGGERQVIEASAGLKGRVAREGERAEASEGESDPHYWLDPNLVIKYVENIRDGLSQADPAGAATYAAKAMAYIAQLQELDSWIAAQVTQVPEKRRLLVTNHEALGYFGDRYGFQIIGTIIPSTSSSASPSAQQLARLVDQIKATGAPAIFLESGSNVQLAEQVAREAKIKVVMGLHIESTGKSAPTYLAMIRYNTQAIVDALK